MVEFKERQNDSPSLAAQTVFNLQLLFVPEVRNSERSDNLVLNLNKNLSVGYYIYYFWNQH